jgi:nitroreductase/dihydropteridine reductase
MNACAELQIDCTPMEGFENDDYNQKLGLTKKGLNACVLLAVGYRHSEDSSQNSKKVRKSIDTIFE